MAIHFYYNTKQPIDVAALLLQHAAAEDINLHHQDRGNGVHYFYIPNITVRGITISINKDAPYEFRLTTLSNFEDYELANWAANHFINATDGYFLDEDDERLSNAILIPEEKFNDLKYADWDLLVTFIEQHGEVIDIIAQDGVFSIGKNYLQRIDYKNKTIQDCYDSFEQHIKDKFNTASLKALPYMQHTDEQGKEQNIAVYQLGEANIVEKCWFIIFPFEDDYSMLIPYDYLLQNPPANWRLLDEHSFEIPRYGSMQYIDFLKTIAHADANYPTWRPLPAEECKAIQAQYNVVNSKAHEVTLEGFYCNCWISIFDNTVACSMFNTHFVMLQYDTDYSLYIPVEKLVKNLPPNWIAVNNNAIIAKPCTYQEYMAYINTVLKLHVTPDKVVDYFMFKSLRVD